MLPHIKLQVTTNYAAPYKTAGPHFISPWPCMCPFLKSPMYFFRQSLSENQSISPLPWNSPLLNFPLYRTPVLSCENSPLHAESTQWRRRERKVIVAPLRCSSFVLVREMKSESIQVNSTRAYHMTRSDLVIYIGSCFNSSPTTTALSLIPQCITE